MSDKPSKYLARPTTTNRQVDDSLISRLSFPVYLWAVAGLGLISPLSGAPLADHATAYRRQLTEKVMPYWLNTVDARHGGYLLADDAKGRGVAREKHLVAQSRMVWGFAHAHLKHLGGAERDYLPAARSGCAFLLERMRDPVHGGYYWRTDLSGSPAAERKIMYGQSFVIYGLVEYYRASGDQEALRQALELFRLIQAKAHDARHGGWIEHFTRDWQPVLQHDAECVVEVGGLKSANTHLHLMEAFTELYETTREEAVKKALIEALDLNRKYFYPPDAGKSCFHRQLDWGPVTAPRSAGLSYGHNVEFAWLMIRAQKVLGQKPAWAHFDAHINHALKYGYDWIRGGLYYKGTNDQPASNTDKVWWAEAELIAALSDSLARRFHPTHAAALEKQIHFLDQYQTVAADGIWLDTVTADGTIKSGGKAHGWKANYHDVRALVKFIETFETSVQR